MPDRADKTVTIPGELAQSVTRALTFYARDVERIGNMGGGSSDRRKQGKALAARLRALAREIGGDE